MGRKDKRSSYKRLYSRLTTPTLLLSALPVPSTVYIESVALFIRLVEWQHCVSITFSMVVSGQRKRSADVI